MPTIIALKAREVLTSRGNPTIEVEVHSETGYSSAIVPSGASTGTHEALELRDGDKKRYGGKGVLTACSHVVKTIAEELVGKEFINQRQLDALLCELDGTPNKSRLGANAILGVSMAFMKETARVAGIPLHQHIADLAGKTHSYITPRPMMNVINGGAHADSGLSIQEFMIVPVSAPTVTEAIRMGAEVFHTLKKLLDDAGEATGVGDEGGFAPHLKSHEAAFDILCEAILQSGYTLGDDIALAIDAAASEFYQDGHYHVLIDGQTVSMTNQELTAYYVGLVEKYPIISIEDSHHEDDFEGFAQMRQALGDRVQLVGDDLYVTNVERIQKGLDDHLTNAVLIKMNQIGTISETLDAILLTQNNGWNAVISHRSGETEDTTIADLCIGTQAGQIKTGSLSRSERIAKYNQLMRIEEQYRD